MSSKPPGFLRRNGRRILLGIVGLLAALVVTGYVLLQRDRRGPPVPVCAGPAIPRKAFGKPIQVTSKRSQGVYANEPAAALLPSGALAIMFQSHGGMFSENGLGVATIGLDGHVEERWLKTERKRHFDAWMTADPKGTLHAVWLGHDGGRPDQHAQIRHATSTDGLTWSVGGAVHDATNDCPNDAPGCVDKPMIAWAGDAALVTYFSEPGEGAKAVRVIDGKATGPSVKVGEGAYGDMHVSPSGKVHVVYASWDEGKVDRFGDRRTHVEMVRSDDAGKSFGKPIRVSAEDEPVPFFFSNAQVAFDEARGLLYVVYPTGLGDGKWSITLATSRDGGKTWQRTKVNDDAPCANHMTPRAALDPRTGALHVIWLENRTGKGGVAYSMCASGGAKCGANEAVSEAPFASYRFSRHMTDWLGEYPVLVLDAEKRFVHAVWAQPVEEDGEPISRIFYARAALP
ncbi:MAG: sialidase family protein [Minicystis sp.]